MSLIYAADPEFIAGTVAAEDAIVADSYRSMDRIHRLQREAGEQRARADALADALHAAQQRIAAQGDELRTLKGENATPQNGCQFYRAILGDAYVLCEYEHTPAEAPIYDADHPGVGPGRDAELALIQVFVNGHWCDPEDILSRERIERIEQDIAESLADAEAAADDRQDTLRAERAGNYP